MCTHMRGFSSQGLAASPPEEEAHEQQSNTSHQPLARWVGRQYGVKPWAQELAFWIHLQDSTQGHDGNVYMQCLQ